MATSRTREGNVAMAEEADAQPLMSRPVGWWGNVRRYFHEVALEMKKVSWPTRTEVINTTIVVVLAVFFFAGFLFATDWILYWVIHVLELGAKKIFT
jgi:preprotein translocase subunit SecE